MRNVFIVPLMNTNSKTRSEMNELVLPPVAHVGLEWGHSCQSPHLRELGRWAGKMALN